MTKLAMLRLTRHSSPIGAVVRWALNTAVVLSLGPNALAAEPAAWTGSFKSNARKEKISVRLVLPAGNLPGSLRFEPPVACDLDFTSRNSANSSSTREYVVVSRALRNPGAVSGPYCAIWLDGTLRLSRVNGALNLQLALSKGDSEIRLGLVPE